MKLNVYKKFLNQFNILFHCPTHDNTDLLINRLSEREIKDKTIRVGDLTCHNWHVDKHLIDSENWNLTFRYIDR